MNVSIVIPAYMESDHLPQLLESLAQSYAQSPIRIPPTIVVVVNNPMGISTQQKESNQKTLDLLQSLSPTLPYPLTILDYTEPGLHYGVGQARKIGMDYAAYHFATDAKDILVCLDADCQVQSNYISTLQNLRLQGSGFTIEFEHDPSQKGMLLYELYLRYMQLNLSKSKSPFSHFTIGSCIGVSSLTYKQVGGMVQKNATEDFHFLNKVRKHGLIEHISTTKVFPSNRKSQRVTLGTGFFLHHYARDPKSSFSSLMIPSPASFANLAWVHDVLYDPTLSNDQSMDFLEQKEAKDTIEHLHKRKIWEARHLAREQNLPPMTYQKRIMESFDGLETLRLLRFLASKHQKPTTSLFLDWVRSSHSTLSHMKDPAELLAHLKKV
ncbi:MAG: hypothetical protein R3A11_02510 [Bdellovibrionota bacterium]